MRIWACLLTLHLFLVITISLQDLSSSLTNEDGAPLKFLWPRLDVAARTLLGRPLSESNPLRQAITTYADGTGIEAGYSYFAPSVPPNCRLTFELSYPDGRVTYDLPPVGGAAAGYRVSTLLDHLQSIHYPRLREALVKTLSYSVWKEHPQAELVRASMAVADLPTIVQYQTGSRVTYKLLYTYNFRFHPRPVPATQQ